MKSDAGMTMICTSQHSGKSLRLSSHCPLPDDLIKMSDSDSSSPSVLLRLRFYWCQLWHRRSLSLTNCRLQYLLQCPRQMVPTGLRKQGTGSPPPVGGPWTGLGGVGATFIASSSSLHGDPDYALSLLWSLLSSGFKISKTKLIIIVPEEMEHLDVVSKCQTLTKKFRFQHVSRIY